eukprot:CAMPEP_0171281858 /NCGR_PEP_ID=MMETSP0790-20130122/66616_1 /TAXON_ID=2925 /ORGANISM="Alexandrium catenella, Strain OF101" /LENGTH=51 /DNA_ID=CAMNT_0011751089 /DNA_START=38 /DNA_END=190 /DNA_ORIENTATION=-
MDFTWSQGFEKRQKAKQGTPKSMRKDDTLPSIDACTPTSANGRTLKESVSE